MVCCNDQQNQAGLLALAWTHHSLGRLALRGLSLEAGTVVSVSQHKFGTAFALSRQKYIS